MLSEILYIISSRLVRWFANEVVVMWRAEAYSVRVRIVVVRRTGDFYSTEVFLAFTGSPATVECGGALS